MSMAVHVQDMAIISTITYALDEHLKYNREPSNHRDRYAVAVLKDDVRWYRHC